MSNALSIYSRPSLLGRSVFDDVFSTFFDDWKPLERQTTQGYPVSDVYCTEDGSTVLEFALAGFRKEDLSIEVKPEKRSITISAATGGEAENKRRIARRSFTKTYVNYDDNLDLGAAQAKFEDGLLTVTVPIRPEVKPLSIDIG
tara:strand:+ start:1956 stop:2387 length:432 start_codon:yes stop_codon:yes gene_type:complete